MTRAPITTAMDALAAGLIPATAALFSATCAVRCWRRGETGIASLYGMIALLMAGITIVVPCAWWPA